MRYRVIWDPNAFENLVRQWTAAGQPESAIEAFDQIESILSNDADEQGESRKGERRILIVLPLGVVFRAFPEEGEVYLLGAWMIRPKPQ